MNTPIDGLTGNVVSGSKIGAAKQSPISGANDHLQRVITDLSDVVDSLFVDLGSVLTPDHPTDVQGMADEKQPAQSEQTAFTHAQAERVEGLRRRLVALKDRLEV